MMLRFLGDRTARDRRAARVSGDVRDAGDAGASGVARDSRVVGTAPVARAARTAAVLAALTVLGACAAPGGSAGGDGSAAAMNRVTGVVTTPDDAWRVMWLAKDDALPVGQLFDLTISAGPGPAATDMAPDDLVLMIDARMPHHRHGMNVVPEVERTGPGRWLVRGMQFQMPGYWELYFDLDLGTGEVIRAQDWVVVE